MLRLADRFLAKPRNHSGAICHKNCQFSNISEIDPSNHCHRELLANFLESLRFSPDPLKGRAKCQEIYKAIRDKENGDVHETDLFFYKLLTDGTAAAYFYGHVDQDLGSKWEEWYKAWWVWKACQRYFVFKYVLGPFLNWIRVILSTATYYFDIVKDVLLVLVLAGVVITSDEDLEHLNRSDSVSRKVIMVLCITSLCASELAKIFLVISSGTLSAKMRLWGTIFVPILPAFLYHRDWRFRVLRRETINRFETNCARALRKQLSVLSAPLELTPNVDMVLTWTRKKLKESSMIKSELRATENFLEHYIHLTILCTLMWIYYDHKDEWQLRLSAEVIGDYKGLIMLSTTISLISLLRGQVEIQYYVALKISQSPCNYKATRLISRHSRLHSLDRGRCHFYLALNRVPGRLVRTIDMWKICMCRFPLLKQVIF